VPKARVYDPSIGRFLQTDPIGTKDDFNLYTYVGNDPLDMTDPSGKTCTQANGSYECIATGSRTNGYSGRSLAVAGIAGATGVGAAALVERAGLGAITKFVANRVVDAGVSAGSQEAKDGSISVKSVVVDAVVGGTVGEGAGRLGTSAARNSAEGKMLERTANRAERIAANSDRVGRQASAESARATVDSNAAAAGSRAGTVAGGAVSGTIQVTKCVRSSGVDCK
jgi:uncharacterized protein RhaS with RHS repeats